MKNIGDTYKDDRIIPDHMNQRRLIWGLVGLILSIAVWESATLAYGQLQSNKGGFADGKNIISVNASITVDVSNDTYKAKSAMLTSAVTNFLNSGPNVLKTDPSSKALVQSKILNQFVNNTQTLEGTEATNAIIGVEINKAMRSVISSLSNSNQTSTVRIDTFTRCMTLALGTSCSNTIMIK